jgi:sialic acid synthase SpsE/sugar phosphate isomerase/epimerase
MPASATWPPRITDTAKKIMETHGMHPVQVYAEIGINHDGEKDKAAHLIQEAARAGVAGIKFQYRNLANAYSGEAREIGDEILIREINKNFLPPETLLELADYARSLKIEVGISFFETADMADFGQALGSFQFFKLPSAELTNRELTDAMLATGRQVFISTGGHTERQVDDALGRLKADNWTPFHCISNYPSAMQNARLGYITRMQRQWKRAIGYSSHDDHWELCVLAMQLGASVIERHITLDKQGIGLDHSSSSTPDEFARMCAVGANIGPILAGDEPRAPNQGELVNMQNLGRSYYAVRDLPKGTKMTSADVIYRAPKVGLGREEIDAVLGQPLIEDLKKNAPLIRSAFVKPEVLPEVVLEFAREKLLSLPVRLHDLDFFQKEIPVQAFEFHLSFKEVASELDVSRMDPSRRYSVHLPDYINSVQLIDPFSDDAQQRADSRTVIDRTLDFAARLQDRIKQPVPVLGSFSVVNHGIDAFYADLAKLIDGYRPTGIHLLPQWLPPIAWYFGGSVRLETFNDTNDMAQLQHHDMHICMDICHLLMGQNFHGFSAADSFEKLMPLVRHVHIADAAGFDAEGLMIGEGEPRNLGIIDRALDVDAIKVIEVWQGHFDRGAGFKKALSALYRLRHG